MSEVPGTTAVEPSKLVQTTSGNLTDTLGVGGVVQGQHIGYGVASALD